MKKIQDLATRKKVPVKADPTEVELLMQIRDLLQGQQGDPVAKAGAEARSDAT